MLTVGGSALACVGALLVVRCWLLLHGRGRPQRGPRPRFVIAGPYRRVRNPLLGGVILIATGVGLATQRVPGVCVAVALASHLWVVIREEPQLRLRFGDAYAAYLARVPRWLPRRTRGRRG